MRREYPVASLVESRSVRYATFCALYAVQGLSGGFVFTALFAWLAQRGLDAAALGRLTAIAAIPGALKLLFGPLVDRYRTSPMGARRPWVILAQAGLLVSVLALLTLDDPAEQMLLLAGILFLQMLFSSIQDLTVDALAVDVVPAAERGKTSAFMHFGRVLGFVVGAFALSQVIDKLGFRSAALLEAATIAVLMVVPFLVRERRTDRPLAWTGMLRRSAADPGTKQVVFRVWRALAFRSSLLTIAAGSSVALAHSVLVTVFGVYIIQGLDWPHTQLSLYRGAIGAAAGLLAAGAAGWLSDRIGHRRMLAFVLCVSAVVAIAFAASAPWWGVRSFVGGYLVLDTALVSMLFVLSAALCLDLSDPSVGASQFAVYMALFNLATVVGYALAEWAQRLPIPLLFLLVSAVDLAACTALAWIDPLEVRKRLATEIEATA